MEGRRSTCGRASRGSCRPRSRTRPGLEDALDRAPIAIKEANVIFEHLLGHAHRNKPLHSDVATSRFACDELADEDESGSKGRQEHSPILQSVRVYEESHPAQPHVERGCEM